MRRGRLAGPRDLRGRLEEHWVQTEAGQDVFYVHAPRRTAVPSVPVVLLHGLVVSSRYMRPTARLLSAHHDVYAPDLPPYGRSPPTTGTPDVPELADALARWLDGLGMDRPSFIGNSYGCQILSEFAVRHPSRADRFVFVGPTMDPAARSVPEQVVRTLRANGREPASYMAVMLRDYLDAGSRAARESLGHALRHPIEERLPQIHRPVLVVRGSRDPIVPQRWAEEVVRLLPDGHLKVIPGGAHALNYGWALDLVRVVGRFLREATGPAALPRTASPLREVGGAEAGAAGSS